MAQRILVVDDNPMMLEVYNGVLGGAGYEVAAFSDGHQALQHLEASAEDPNLILLDVDMPRMTGWELLATIRERVEWQDVPVVMVTSLAEPPPERIESLPSFQHYVTKKKTGQELLELVEQYLGHPEPAPSESSETAPAIEDIPEPIEALRHGLKDKPSPTDKENEEEPGETEQAEPPQASI